MTETEIKVESKVAIPRPAGLTKYPFDKMKVGDSFAVEWKHCKNARQACFYDASRSKRKYTTRKMDGKLRIWRTS